MKIMMTIIFSFIFICAQTEISDQINQNTIKSNITNDKLISWINIGDGFNDEVYAIAATSNKLYAGGRFITAGSDTVYRIALWDGNSWSKIGEGFNSPVTCLAIAGNGDLYAAGFIDRSYGNHIHGLAKWNGKEWSAVGDIQWRLGVKAITVSDNGIYVGGGKTSFDNGSGSQHEDYIARWDGSKWYSLGPGIDSEGMNGLSVEAIAVSGKDVYVGGRFRKTGGVIAMNIAKWDGAAWSALGEGLGWEANSVNSIAITVDGIYAGGSFSKAGEVNTGTIAKWNGSSWSALGDGLNFNVYAIVKSPVSDYEIYVGGYFLRSGSKDVKYFAKWGFDGWTDYGSVLDGHVNTIVLAPNVDPHTVALYLGGSFTSYSDNSINRIVEFRETDNPLDANSSIYLPDEFFLNQNYPNPFNPSTNIEIIIPETGNLSVKIYDMLGNEIIELINGIKSPGKYKLNFDGRNLTSGVYICSARLNNNFISRKMLLLK